MRKKKFSFVTPQRTLRFLFSAFQVRKREADRIEMRRPDRKQAKVNSDID